jgi:hypothetical protein
MEGIPEPQFLHLGSAEAEAPAEVEKKLFRPHVAEFPKTRAAIGEVAIRAVDTEPGDLPSVVS